jgi:hypothetical protein
MNVVTTIFPKTTGLLCHFHVGKNAKAKRITYYIVKPKVVKMDEKDKEVKEAKVGKIVKNMFRACKNVVESPSKESYADVVEKF